MKINKKQHITKQGVVKKNPMTKKSWVKTFGNSSYTAGILNSDGTGHIEFAIWAYKRDVLENDFEGSKLDWLNRELMYGFDDIYITKPLSKRYAHIVANNLRKDIKLASKENKWATNIRVQEVN